MERNGRDLRRRAGVAVAVFLGAGLGVAGWTLDFFQRVAWFDELAHFYNGFAVALFLGVFLYGASLRGADDHPVALVCTVVLLGLGVGGGWEIGEWVYDRLSTAGNLSHGKDDTILDLMWDTAGATVAGFMVLRIARKE